MCHLIFESLDAAPGAHDEGVVHGHDGDDVYAFGFEFVVFLEVGWCVVYMASWLNVI